MARAYAAGNRKAVIDAVARLMGFGPYVGEPARSTLHRFGHVSSILVFYELAYFEAKRRVMAGNRFWMLAFVTEFKGCSNVWRALRDGAPDADNPWNGCIHRYRCHRRPRRTSMPLDAR